MNPRPLLIVVFVLLLAAAPALAGGKRAKGPDPAVAEWPKWPHKVTCGGLAFAPVPAFSSPTGVEREDTAPVRALKKFMNEGIPEDRIHSRDWRVLNRTPRVVEFASGRLGRGVEWIAVFKRRGNWRFASYSSDCEPESVRKGRAAITWSLGEDGPRISPATRELVVDLGPGECSGGLPQADRLMKPEFRRQNGALLMTLWLRPLPPGNYTCEEIEEPPVTIELPAPLGGRELLDGGTYPPRSAFLRQ